MISRRGILSLLAAPPARPCAVAVGVASLDLLRCDDRARMDTLWAPPGSTLKPFTLLSLADPRPVACAHTLRLSGHLLDCSHLPLSGPLDPATALAASCNCWFAENARRLDPVRFQHRLLQAGAKATRARSLEDLQLQALGLENVLFTPLGLARAYARLARQATPQILDGLEQAVREGTAQWAALDHLSIAGKTGTTSSGAWFAGFAPARRPQIAVAAFVPAGTGGADAAPLARELFAWWQRTASSR